MSSSLHLRALPSCRPCGVLSLQLTIMIGSPSSSSSPSPLLLRSVVVRLRAVSTMRSSTSGSVLSPQNQSSGHKRSTVVPPPTNVTSTTPAPTNVHQRPRPQPAGPPEQPQQPAPALATRPRTAPILRSKSLRSRMLPEVRRDLVRKAVLGGLAASVLVAGVVHWPLSAVGSVLGVGAGAAGGTVAAGTSAAGTVAGTAAGTAAGGTVAGTVAAGTAAAYSCVV